jgi:allantoinase
MGIDLVLRSERVVTPAGVRPASVAVANGRIAAVADLGAPHGGAPAEDLGDLALLPGAVDTHVHVDEPGRAEWEGFETATRAAAAGGVTTFVDMPLNSIPPTTTVVALAAKRAAARGRITVDVGFWGGAVPGNAGELAALHAAGVLGFKAFLVPSGVDEFPPLDRDGLVTAAQEIARLGSVLLVHAEAPDLVAAGEGLSAAERRSHAAWARSRPPAAEAEAIGWLAAAARATDARCHVVHVSSRAGIEVIRAAQREGLPLSAETCPHYLTFASEHVPAGGVEWKCAPPIRGAAEREALWRALDERTLALVASDHSPCPPAMKTAAGGDLFAAWGGIASLQVSLAATWTGARERGHGLERLAEWTATAPARLAGLVARKGAIAPGRDADFAVFDPEASFRVDGDSLYHRHPMTPYDGRTLRGVVRRTYLRGIVAFDAEAGFGAPVGALLAR